MPLKPPHLQSKYKTQHHHCGAGIYPNLLSSDLPKGCGEGKWAKYFSIVCLQNYDSKYIYQMRAVKSWMRAKGLFASGSAQEGLYIDIKTANYFDFWTEWPRFDPPWCFSWKGKDVVLCLKCGTRSGSNWNKIERILRNNVSCIKIKMSIHWAENRQENSLYFTF